MVYWHVCWSILLSSIIPTSILIIYCKRQRKVSEVGRQLIYLSYFGGAPDHLCITKELKTRVAAGTLFILDVCAIKHLAFGSIFYVSSTCHAPPTFVFHDDGGIAAWTSAFALGDPPSVFWKFKFISRIRKVHGLHKSGNVHNLIYVYIYICCVCVSPCVIVHVSDPPNGVPCPGAGVFVMNPVQWARPVGTCPASLLCLPRFHTHPILCASTSPLLMGDGV